jgi:hypothetical protein
MLTTFLGWLYFSFLSILYGYLALGFCRRLFGLHDQRLPDLPLLALVGFCAIGLITESVAIFRGVDLVANGIILAVGLLLLLAFRSGLLTYLRSSLHRFQGWHPILWAIFAAALLFALTKSTDVPLNYDTGLYHTQALRWIEAYGTVPGLGNLHARLAYNSVWFPLVSLTGLSFLPFSSFHIAGSLLMLLTLLLLLDRFNALIQGEMQLAGLMSLVLIFASRRLFSRELSSPSTDMPTSLIFWVVILLWVEKWEREECWQFDLHSVVLFSLSVYAITLKVTAAPLLLIPAAILLSEIRRGHWGTLAPCSMLALAILLPWAIRGILLSGYLIYPFAPLDLFSFDWEMPREQVVTRLIGDRSWARNPGTVGREILSQPIWRWMPRWFRKQENFDQQLLILSAASLVAFVSTFWLTRGAEPLSERRGVAFWLPYMICGTGVVYWVYSAPYVRFGYPVLGIFLALSLSPLMAWALDRFRGLRLLFLGVAVAGAIAVHLVSLAFITPGTIKSRLIQPARYPKVQLIDHELGGQKIYTPEEGDQCWDAPIPCAPRLDPDLVPRGESLASGYRIQEPD